jgi:hypothetical protein
MACLVTMVQGNVLALTASHLIIASQTGIIAGVLTGVAIIAAKARNRWIISIVLGVITAVVDFYVHPGMFGSAATEAIVTGIGAAVLSLLISTGMRFWRERAAKPDKVK